jgi:hypothetical protein
VGERWRVCGVVAALVWALGGGVAEAQGLGGEPEICLKVPTAEPCRIVRVEAVLVDGLISTERHVIDRELRFEEGQIASIAQIEDSMARLRNTGLFRSVNYQLIARPLKELEGEAPLKPARAQSRIVRIVVDERWTLLPAFLFAQGGDLTSLNIALYDTNVAGKYFELGVEYGRLGYTEDFWSGGGAANSFVAWARKPRFLDTYWWVSADVWSVKRLRSLYDKDGGIEGGFLLDRVLLRARAEYEIERQFWAGFGLEYMGDEFSEQFISEERRAAQRANFGGLPDPGRAVRLSGVARIGRVNQDVYQIDGWRVSGTLAHSDPLWGATYRFTQLGAEALWYKSIPWRGNIAARLRVDVGDATQIQHLYYIGGLSEVRGYADSRFRGRNAWVGNLEYRVAPFVADWVVLQGIGFLDAGGVSSNPTKLTSSLDAAAAGVGLRLIVPKIYRLVMRFDYAFPLVAGDNSSGFSFGAQQFF